MVGACMSGKGSAEEQCLRRRHGWDGWGRVGRVKCRLLGNGGRLGDDMNGVRGVGPWGWG